MDDFPKEYVAKRKSLADQPDLPDNIPGGQLEAILFETGFVYKHIEGLMDSQRVI